MSKYKYVSNTTNQTYDGVPPRHMGLAERVNAGIVEWEINPKRKGKKKPFSAVRNPYYTEALDEMYAEHKHFSGTTFPARLVDEKAEEFRRWHVEGGPDPRAVVDKKGKKAKLAMMVHECYDGITLCRSDNGLRVRVMHGDVVPLDWAKHPDSELAGKYFRELPGCFGNGFESDCRHDGCLCGQKCDEYKDKNRKEEVMGEETIGEAVKHSGCFGGFEGYDGYDDDNPNCQKCKRRDGCKECNAAISVFKEAPVGRAHEMIGGRKYPPDPTDREHPLDDADAADAAALVAFDKIQALLNDKVPTIMQHTKGNVPEAVGMLLNGLVNGNERARSLEADLNGMQAADGREGDSRRDGTFMSRDEGLATGVIRRVRRMDTPCDSQDGEDVCADAGGAREWMK